MSLSRAFTNRRGLQRNLTNKSSVANLKISAPVELLSTTNMLSYNAPDLYPSSNTSRSSQSGDESERTPSDLSTPMTSPDTSSIESSPTSAEPNHLSCYFGGRSSPDGSLDNDAPTIPRRAPSHTKKLSIERSTSRKPNTRFSASRSMSTIRSSINMFSSQVDIVEQQHSFGNELAQVSELAEDFGITKEKLAVIDEEEKELVSRGLFKFCAEDYASEIQGLFMSAFGDARPVMSSMWI